MLVARNEEALSQVATELSAKGTRAIAVPADVAKREDLERVARTAIETFGGFDTWVNDAAVALYGTLEEIDRGSAASIRGELLGCRQRILLAAQHLRERGGGAIINIGSVLSERAMIFQTQYSASKHAVKAFTDGLRMELEREGAPISVTLIKPSAIDTPYPEHARNYLEDELKTPPPVYDRTSCREGRPVRRGEPEAGTDRRVRGWMIGALGTVAPRLVDKAMELTGYASQTTNQPERPRMRDNLYSARQDGDEYSSLRGEPRKTSMFLSAQMHPSSPPRCSPGSAPPSWRSSCLARPMVARAVRRRPGATRRSSASPATGTTGRRSVPAIAPATTPSRVDGLSRDTEHRGPKSERRVQPRH